MTVITKNDCISEKTAVALGLFDGVHLGHREVIKFSTGFERSGFVPAVFTFKSFTVTEKQGRKQEYIYTDCQKNAILEDLGIKYCYSADFSSVKELSGEEFVCDILLKKLNAYHVVCGHDFRFGKNASCGIEELVKFGQKRGFGVIIAPDIEQGGEKISSKRIRELLENGKIKEANSLLGGSYNVTGEVVHGNELGRTLDFPTINQHFAAGQLVPKRGVYYTRTFIGGKVYPSVTNVGVKPTVEENIQPLAETHILGFSGDLYGRTVEVEFCGYIRGERKFASLEELKNQVFADIAYVRKQYETAETLGKD